MEAIGIEPDKNKLKMQGTSLMKYVYPNMLQKIKNTINRNVYYNSAFTETGGLYGPWPSPDKPNIRCIRTKQWKLIHNETPDTWELYNILKDPDENNNLYGKNLKIEKILIIKLKKIIEDCKKS